MWSSDRSRTAWRPGAFAAALLALSACTSGPLYGTTAVDPVTGGRSSVLEDLRGRIAVAAADTRTAQVFRNEILYRLNGAEPVREPLYELRFVVTSSDQVVSIESGTGIPSASLFRMTVDFTLVRLADSQTIGSGQRFAMAPYDRTTQLFASERALIDARDQAGRTVAERVLLVVAPILQREAFAAPPDGVVTKG